MKEQWKPIPGYEGLYEVSDHGNVRSLDHTVTRRTKGGGFNTVTHKGKNLSAAKRSRYLFVGLHKQGTKQITPEIHKLVMSAFVGPRPEGMEVCHGDGDGNNNHLSNLRYDTRAANSADKAIHGTIVRGEHQHSAVLNSTQVNEIRWAWSHGFGQKEIGDYFGVKRNTISAITTGVNWSHLSYA